MDNVREYKINNNDNISIVYGDIAFTALKLKDMGFENEEVYPIIEFIFDMKITLDDFHISSVDSLLEAIKADSTDTMRDRLDYILRPKQD